MKPEIVAEISGNHGQRFDMAEYLVMAASRCGADAVKLQCWTPGTMVIGKAAPMGSGLWEGVQLQKLYTDAGTPWDWFTKLFELAKTLKIGIFSSVFDHGALAYLEYIGCERYKIASAELVDIPLIRAVAATGKPMIMSTGMATRAEIHEAWEAASIAGATDITLLHCVSAYPTAADGVNMQTMLEMGERYRGRAMIGFSDHTRGIAASVAASFLGASMIEKHLTMSETAIDAPFSVYPDEFKRMATECRAAAKMMGTVTYGPRPGDVSAVRRGVYFATTLPPGHKIGVGDLVTARPATEIMPAQMAGLLGATVKATVRRGQAVTPEVLDLQPVDQAV